MSFAKDDPDEAEAEEKFEEKDDQSPWADSDDEDNSARIMGWRDGEALTRQDIRQILRRESDARDRYDALRERTQKRPAEVDPLSGLPPDWQAVYSLAPDVDAQTAWSRAKLEENRQKRQKKETLDDRLAWESRPGETIDQEISRLKVEFAEVKKVVSENKKVQEDWTKKLEECQKSLQAANGTSRTVLRAFETASYDHSVAKGQLRSSEMYFQFLTQDTKQNAHLQVTTLERSCALMDKTMDLLKGHIRTLQEVANMSASELEPFASPSPAMPSPSPPAKTPLASPMGQMKKLRALKVPPVSPSLRD